MIAIHEYEDEEGRRPFSRWFDELNIEAAVRMETALARLEAGNVSNVKSTGAGVFEIRVHSGPGYRIYYGKDTGTSVIVLAGGTKKTQPQDIRTAKRRWKDFKNRQQKDGN